MLEQVVDLHIHSKYSRACSKQLELPQIAAACGVKGIDIAATGDFTHPAWFAHLTATLEETEEGVYKLKEEYFLRDSRLQRVVAPTRFVLGTEISCIYKHGDATRRLHLLIFAPNLATVKKFNTALEARGVNLKADGRPIMGLTGKEIVQLCLDIDERMMVVPAHAWTPWFAVFGSKSGYDSLEECFEELTPNIRAIETGLSSDPDMNRRLSALDGITLISNSDAHGLENLGREANVFGFTQESDITYAEITRIIKQGDRARFLYTIEFYPEEGKYHFDGHKDCVVSLSPEATRRAGGRCPKCKRPLTIGVLNRVAELADRTPERIPTDRFVPQRSIVPLKQILSSIMEVGAQSRRVGAAYDALIRAVGNEFYILLHADSAAITAAGGAEVGEAVQAMRLGNMQIIPGYDGVYGVIKPTTTSVKKATQSKLF